MSMERGRRAGIKVQDVLDDVKPSGLWQASRAEQVSYDWAGWLRLTNGNARANHEGKYGDQRCENSSSVHGLVLPLISP
jgi:hypothetical protein